MMLLTTVMLAAQLAAGPTDAPPSLERALEALEQGERERVAIGVFGASHVEAGKLTRRLRERLGDRYGARGRGFIDPKPTKKVTPGDRVRRRVRGEHTWVNGHHVDDGEAMSLSGHKLRLGPGAQLEMNLCAGCAAPTHRDLGTITVSWLNSDDAQGALIVDDVVIGDLSPSAEDGPVRQLTARVRGDRHTVEVLHTSTGGALELLSVVYERDAAGVIVDGLGLSGATGERFSAFNARVLADQVRARDYDLVVFAWGTNEAGKIQLDPARYEARLRQTMRTVLDATDGAGCMYFGPTDRLVRRGGRWKPAPQHDRVVQIQQRVAQDMGCGYFDAAEAMGGRGSMDRWRRRGLALPDNTHLTSGGYRRMADTFLARLLPSMTPPRRRASAVPRRVGPR